eukprot:5575339-Pyramimonas_sp.AAC.1
MRARRPHFRPLVPVCEDECLDQVGSSLLQVAQAQQRRGLRFHEVEPQPVVALHQGHQMLELELPD